LIGIVYASSNFYAQNIRVQEVVENMSKGTQKGLAIEFTQISEEFLLKEFKDWVDKFKGKTKMDKKNNEVFSDDAFLKEISANTFDIYGKVINKGKTQTLVLFVDLGGAFLNTQMHADKYKIMEGQFMEFARSVIQNDLKNRLDEAEKVLKNFEKEKKDLEQEQAKSLKNIENAKNLIKKEEENKEFALAIGQLVKESSHLKANPQNDSDIDKFRIWYEQCFNEMSQELTDKGPNELKTQKKKKKNKKGEKTEEELQTWAENNYSKINTSLWFKILKAKDNTLEKYELWKEQKATCIYTGKIISLSDLFNEDLRKPVSPDEITNFVLEEY